MKFVKMLAVFALVNLMSGCGGTIPNIGTFITTGFQNPIGRNEVAAIVSTYNALLVPTRAYMNLRICKTGETFTTNVCGEPAVRSQIKSAVRRAQSLRRELSDFVAKNDTVNAQAAYNEFSAIVDILKTVPTKSGG